MTANRRLGRGLGGLLSSTVPETTPEEARAATEVPVQDIRPNPFQPRQAFDEASLADLRSSIAEHGVLQPIVVRRAAGGYEVVAGERRLRACRSLGMSTIPAIVREVEDSGMQTLALVENVQREDLNAIEKARALRAMMTTQSLTQEEVANRVGKDRATIANLLRLLELPEEVRQWVEAGKLSGGQARALLQVVGDPKRVQLARLAMERDLSVRDVERYARLAPGGRRRGEPARDAFLGDIEDRLRKALSAKVTMKRKGKGGTIEIHFADSVQLDALLEKMHAV